MPGRIEITISFAAVGGTASCDVCGTLIAWKLPWDGIEELELDGLRCPRCGGAVELDLDSLIPELEIVTVPPAHNREEEHEQRIAGERTP